MTNRILRRVTMMLALAGCIMAGEIRPLAQQQPPARFLAKEEIILYGVGLKVEPARQVVPKDIATIVSTFLQAPTLPEGLPPFAPDAEVRATLRGPSFADAQELVVRPNTPFNIPPLTVAGIHTLENIRLISNGEILLRGVPESVVIEVIEKLLITQVTARALTAAEIREKGIVFDKSSFQAYNFSAAFAIEDRKINIDFPVVLPQLQSVPNVSVGEVNVPQIQAPALPNLQTIIPDTLKLQTQIPNLSVIGFTLKLPTLQGQDLFLPPIPGVIVIPGDIGFLNQFFSVMLMVGNVAPAGSNLVVSNLEAEIVLPPGNDLVVGSGDDPLRMARNATGETPRKRLVVQPGPDGKLGTADDIGTLGPGETGNAEYLVEGMREGSHVVEMEMKGTLNGLPVGPVEIRGRAAGAVLVRNPTFTLTFTHPEVVNAGEPYTLDVTVTNSGLSPANFVSLNLYPRNVSGATIVGSNSREIETILPGDSATVAFDLISRMTGKVTAATLDSNENVAGRFALKTAVGELGVPLSPDSLVLPKEAKSLPAGLREAAIGLLGKAWAVATAPAAALPKDVARFSKKIVIDRAVEVAEAGFRVSLREPLADSAAHLAMDFIGNKFAWLPQFNPRPEDLEFAQDNFAGFDALRRASVRGDRFADAVAGILGPDLVTRGPLAFHSDLATRWSYRPVHISVLLAGLGGNSAPYRLSIVDAQGRRVGGTGANGKIIKEIPFSDLLVFELPGGGHAADLALLGSPDPGMYRIRLERVESVPDGVPYALSIVVPDLLGGLRQLTFQGISGQGVPVAPASTDPHQVVVEVFSGGEPVPGSPIAPQITSVVDPPPTILGALQQAEADQLRCDPEKPGFPVGRVIALLFSEEVTAASVQDKLKSDEITNYLIENNQVVGVALQPGRRIAFLALRDPYGPYVPRQIAVSNVMDARGQAMPTATVPIEPTIGDDGGVLTGKVMNADGTAVPFANVRLFYLLSCGEEPAWIGISSKSADAQGRYSWDFVTKQLPNRIVAVDPETQESRDLRFNVQRKGQRLNVDVVFLGRGTFKGRTLAEDGRVLTNTSIRVTSLTDNSQYGATSDAEGRFAIARIPVGSLLVEAVNVGARAQFFFSEHIPFAGAITSRDITLLDVELREITIKTGRLQGYIYQPDGLTPLGDVPVIAYYQTRSQPDVKCPEVGSPPFEPPECAVGVVRSAADGAFLFEKITAGALRLYAFDQGSLAQGGAHVILPIEATRSVNILLAGGLGTVTGRVVDPSGAPVVGARVGGGFTLTTTNAQGEFTLSDVPVGSREIVAVSDELGTSGSMTVDIARAGEVVGATIVLRSVGSVSGRILKADGTPAGAGIKVYLFRQIMTEEGPKIQVVGTATTDGSGGYRMDKIQMGAYDISAFTSDFSDGNIGKVVLKFHQQVFRADLKFRGGGGIVHGVVYDDDGQTPLKARLGISGDQLVVAGGQVGVAFQYVQNYKIVDTNFTTGQYQFSGLWVGGFTLRAVGQFSPDPVTVESAIPAPNETVEVNLRLQSTSQVKGVVYLPDGVTPAGENVVIHYKSEEFKVFCTENKFGEETCITIPQGIQSMNAVTDASGRFFFPIVNAGSFTLTAEDPVTGKVAHIRGSVKAGETADLSMRLLGIADLTVQVFASNATTPIANAKVEVQQLAYPNVKRTLIAGPDGTIVFGGGDAFSEGELLVTATDQSNGFAGTASTKIVKDGQGVLVKVYLYNAAGTVYGTVFRSDGITPVANAEVVISNALGPLGFAVTGPDGTYRQELIPLGQFFVETFEAATARRAFASGRVDLANQEVPINLVQAGLGVVKGVLVQGGTLSPLKGWEITLLQTSEAGRTLPTLKTTTSLDGSWSFPGTSRGTFTATARKQDVQGSTSATGTIEREGQIVDVPLVVNILRELRGRVEGTTFNPDGTPAPNTIVEICYAGRCSFDIPPVRVTTDTNGFYFLDDVPLGRFSVTALAQVTRNVGKNFGDMEIDGDILTVDVRMVGLTVISGVVLNNNGTPNTTAIVKLDGSPATGCSAGEGPVPCTQGVKPADGTFSFVDVPAKTFTVSAQDAVSQLKGAVGGTLNPGEHKNVTVVLEPTGSVAGRVFTAGGKPAQGIVAELILAPGAGGERRLYQETKMDGSFLFDPAPLAAYTLVLQDPIGPGLAQRTGTVAGNGALGDIVLDEAAPAIASSVPAPSAQAVPLNQAIRLTFTEPILPGTVNATNVVVESPTGPINYALNISDGDTVATLTPLVPLKDETRYIVRVENVKDRVGKLMAAAYTASFTTVDITAPSFVSISPAPNTNGVTIYTPIRIQFSEPIDPARFRGPPFRLTGPQDAAIAGRLDYTLGNTVLVFTPNLPLAEDAAYRVRMSAAADPSDNAQPQALDYLFTTTDRTPPQILGLVAANNGTVIENTTTSVTANVGLSHDVAVVDWYINDVFVFAGRAVPFVLSFKAIPDFGGPGSQIKISAIAIDSSGNRGTSAATTFITVTPDQTPTAQITTPASGISARNGDRITVNVLAADDVGLTQVGYKAGTGQPQDALIRRFDTPKTPATESFAFTVPPTAVPGSTIVVEASVVDTKGHVVQAAPISITVLDAVNPTVTITGTSTGSKVNPGQMTTAIVSVEDLGGVASMTFTVGGIVTSTETKVFNPAQNSIAASFAIQVPSTARPGQSLTLDATATDRAGNLGTAARVILPVADTIPPTVQLTTESGTNEMVRGQPVTVFADAEDGIAVSRVELSGQGAFTVADAKPVSPPIGSARLAFTINVPDTLEPGALLNLRATAVDISGNVSAPALLTLAVKALSDVTLPASEIVIAGESKAVTVQLAQPAPAGGLRLDFTTANSNIATVTPTVLFAAGETTREIQVTGVSGGSAAIRALILGVQRASMTVTVRGGIVRGVVRDSLLQPVAGVELTINGAVTATSNGNGEYFAEGVPGFQVSVKAFDPVSRQRGHATAFMNQSNGFAIVNVILIRAGAIRGDVKTAAGAPAGAGVTVEIFAANDLNSPLDFTFTDPSSLFEFPLVTQGSYVLQATSLTGQRGRASVAIGFDGDEEVTTIAFLGEGSVVGRVLDGGGNPVPRAPLKFKSFSVFGATPTVSVNAEADGSFRFDHVAIGTFTIEARDEVTGQGGTSSGAITQNGQVVTSDVTLATFGGLQGVVRRPDGVTPAVGALVRVHGHTTITNDLGQYGFAFLPLGSFTVTVFDEGTRQQGRATGTLTTQGVTETANVTLHPQGSVIVTVTDASGNLVAGASVVLSASGGGFSDTLSGETIANGTVLIERVLAGSIQVDATFGNLKGKTTSTLAAGEVKSVTVALEPTGVITGTIYEPDGQTPAAGAQVDVTGVASMTTAGDGVYRFEGLRLPPSYNLSVRDSQGRQRAYTKTSLKLTGAGQVITRDFTMVGLGTVTGRVVDAQGNSGIDLGVTVTSFHPDFGGQRNGMTNAGGFYTIENVPVAPFLVKTGDPGRLLLGEGAGTIETHGATATVDILLTSNAVAPPIDRYDANNYLFDLQRNGSTRVGSTAFRNLGGLLLDVVAGGVPTRFEGATIATIEDGGRELAVRQDIAGLSVTRKIAVPRTGYFARYLDVFTNLTAQPVSIDVRVTSQIRQTVLLATSSGDAVFDVASAETADRWIVLDDTADAESGVPATAFVFDGEGGAERVAAAGLSLSPGEFTHEWRSVTVPPNGSVAYLYFVSQQTSRAAALASANRLALVPPEALDGLSLEELAAIRNFVVPADGQSTVEPLPRLDATVTGHAIEGDGVTSVGSGSTITFRSTHPLFGRSHTATTNGSGAFSLTAAFNDSGSSRLIPVNGFTLQGKHPASNVMSPVTPGAFAEGATTADVDVVFSNTGLFRGVVRRHNGVAVTSGFVNIAGQQRNVASDASFAFSGIASGTYDATATLGHSQGTALFAHQSVVIVAGTVTTETLTIEATGGARGSVLQASGAPVVGIEVRLTRQGFSRTTATDTAGQFNFPDVPTGTFNVASTDPSTGQAVVRPVVVVQDQTTVAPDLTFLANGMVQVDVKFARGAVAPGGSVHISEVARGNTFRSAGTTDSQGRLTITNVPQGAFTVRAFHPADTRLFTDVAGALATDGQAVPVSAVLPGTGTLTGHVKNQDGSPVGDVAVTVRSSHPMFGGFYTTRTDATGLYRQDLLALGNVSATVLDTTRQLFGEAFAVIDADGQTVTADIQLTNNAIPLPTSLWDANNYVYEVTRHGGVQSGTGFVFHVYSGDEIGAMILELVSGGSVHRFTGGSVGTVEQNGREIAVRQSLAGLDVTRKAFVPRNGYFARYVDTFANPSPDPISVDIRVLSNTSGGYYYSPSCGCYSYHPLAVIRTSSGDTTLDVSDSSSPDRWVVLEDTNPYKAIYGPNTPAVAFAFDGPGGVDRADAANHAVPSADNSQIVYEWRTVTIPANSAVSYMHFVLQQSSQAAAQASAERLLQLPPEALDGLNVDELAAIRNFKMPADGLSTVPALPSLTGTVTGRAFTNDGATPIPGANVTFLSTNPLFQRPLTTTTDSAGSYLFRGALLENGASTAIPVEGYSITVQHPNSNVTTPSTGGFGGTFTGNLSLFATVSASSEHPSGYFATRAVDGNLDTSWFTNPGDAANQGASPHIEVTLPSAAIVTQVNIRGNREFPDNNDFFRGRIDLFNPLGDVLLSQVADLPAPTRDFDLAVSNLAGVRRVRFTGLLDESSDPGLAEFEVIGTLPSAAGIARHDVSMTNTATFRGRVLRASGVPVSSGDVYINNGPSSGNATIAADGSYSITGLRAGSYQLYASIPHPQGSYFEVFQNATAVIGQTTTVDITLPPTGTLTGLVRTGGGVPAANVTLALSGSFYYQTTTDGTGRFTFEDVRTGEYDLYAYEPNTGFATVVHVTINPNQTTTQDVSLIGLGAASVQVQRASGAVAPNGLIYVDRGNQGFFDHAGSADSQGRFTVPFIPVGQFKIRAYHPLNTSYFVDVPGTITAHGETVPILAVLPAVGTITGTIRLVNGSLYTNRTVQLIGPAGQLRQNGTTNSSGVYTFGAVGSGEAVVVRAFHPTNSQFRRDSAPQTITVDGEIRTVDLVLPAVANLRVTVLKADGTPFAGARIEAKDQFRTAFQNRGNTNSAGQLTLSGQPEGETTIRVRDASTGLALFDQVATIAPANDGQILDVLIQVNLFAGAIQGTVRTSDGAIAIANGLVEVFNAADLTRLASTDANASGAYSFSNVLAGNQGLIVRAHAPNDTTVTVDRPHTFTAAGQTATIDLPLPALRGRVEGTVFATDGTTVIPGVNVQIFAASNMNKVLASIFTNAQGVFAVDNLLVKNGAFVVRVNSAIVVEQAGAFSASGQTAVVAITLPLRYTALQVHVTAADQATPVSNVYIEVRATNGTFLTSTYTQQTGIADFGQLLLPASGVVLHVYYNSSPDDLNLQIPTATEEDGTVLVDVVLPLSTVKGRVTFSDGSAAPYPGVMARSPGEVIDGEDGPEGITRHVNWNDENGNFALFGPPVGPVIITAQDGNSGLSVTVESAVVALGVPVIVNTQLPPSGTVRGRLLDSAGNPVRNGDVTLSSSNLQFDRYESTDETGVFEFERVGLGPVSMQAQTYASPIYLYTSGALTLTVPDQVVPIDLRFAAPATLSGVVTDGAGNPLPEAYVYVQGFGSIGPLGYPNNSVSTGSDGRYQMLLSPGPFQVYVQAYNGNYLYGWATGTLTAGGTLTLNVAATETRQFNINLDGADGFRYDINSDGSISDGGLADGSQTDAFDTAMELEFVDRDGFCCAQVPSFELNDRQLVLGPLFMDSMLVTRKVFVPVSGGFARYLESISNPSSVSRRLRVMIRTDLGAGSTSRVVVGPATTGNTYAITDEDQGEGGGRPAVAHVFAGPGAPVAVSATDFRTEEDDVFYIWDVTVPPGETVGLLHFIAQRLTEPASGQAPTRAQAEALVNLSDPAALEGLTPQERSQIVNFVISGGGSAALRGTIEGTVFAGDGVTPLPGALVQATDAATGYFLMALNTDSAGRYRFTNVLGGTQGVRIIAHMPLMDAEPSSRLVTFGAAGEVVSNVNLVVNVSALKGTVTAAGGAPVSSPLVLASGVNGNGTPATFAAHHTGNDGSYLFVGLPAGTIEIIAQDVTGARARGSATVAAGATTVLNLQLSAGAICEPAPDGLAAWYPGNSTAASMIQGAAAGTLLNGASYVPGMVGEAFRLDGVDDLVTFPNDATPRGERVTLSTWVRFSPGSSTLPFAREQVVVYKRNAAASFQFSGLSSAYMLLKDSGNRLTFTTTSELWGARTIESTTTVEPDRFYHVAATSDGSTLRLYVDGMLEATATGAQPLEHGTGPLTLGGTGASEQNPHCACTIDEPQVYSRDLGPGEIQLLFAAGPEGTCDTFRIVNARLPGGYVNAQVADQLLVAGGTAPTTFGLAIGSSLPDGLSLTSSGLVTGTSATPGDFSFNVIAVDAHGLTATATVSKTCLPCATAPAGLLSLWPANDSAADVISTQDGALRDGASLVPGFAGRAFSFGGDSGYVASATQVLSTPANTFTMEFWAFPSATRPTTIEAVSGMTGAGQQRYAIGPEYRGIVGLANIGVSVGTNGVSVFEHGPSYAPSPLVYNATIAGWTHIAVVYENRTPRLYLNGVLVRIGLQSSQSVSPSKMFGDYFGYGAYKGLLDDIGLYDRALSSADVAAIFAAGSMGKCPR